MNPWLIFLIAVAAFGAGWQVQDWRKSEEILTIKAEQVSDRAAVAEKAFDDLRTGTEKMQTAATELTGIKLNLDGKLDKISMDLKNAQAKSPLPVDCKPDDERVRNLKAAVDAANSAASGQ